MSLVRASIWLTISEFVFNLSGYIIHSVLGRSLGPAEYGRYSLVIFAAMIVVLVGRGIPIAMSKYLSEIRKDSPEQIPHIKKTSASIQTVLIGSLAIVYFLLAPVIAKILNDPSLTPLLRVSSLIVPAFALASFYVYYFTGIHRFDSQAILKLFRSIAKVGLILTLGIIFSTTGAIVGHALAPFSVFILAYAIDPFRKTKIKFKIQKSKLNWKKILNFAWPITIFLILYELMISVDFLMIKILLKDDSLAGLYSSALNISRIPFYVFYFLTIILLPKISETTSRKDDTKTKEVLRTAMRFLFLLLLPSVTLLSFFRESVIEFFYGRKYLAAEAPLEILAFGAGFLTIFYVLAFVLNGAGKNKIPMWTALLGVITNAILSFLLIKELGLIGGAIANSVSSFLVMITISVYSCKKIAIFIKMIPIIKYVLGSGIVYLIASFIFPQHKVLFILYSLFLFAIYLVFLLIIKEVDKNDWKMFWSGIKKGKKKK